MSTSAPPFNPSPAANGNGVGTRSLVRPSANFPASIADDLDLAVASNRLQTTLAATLSDIALSMTVASASQIVAHSRSTSSLGRPCGDAIMARIRSGPRTVSGRGGLVTSR